MLNRADDKASRQEIMAVVAGSEMGLPAADVSGYEGGEEEASSAGHHHFGCRVGALLEPSAPSANPLSRR